jgi:hypothetical protein
MGVLMHRVYEAELLDGEKIMFCCNAVWAQGEKLIKLESLVLIHETPDRNEARAMCNYHEF